MEIKSIEKYKGIRDEDIIDITFKASDGDEITFSKSKDIWYLYSMNGNITVEDIKEVINTLENEEIKITL